MPATFAQSTTVTTKKCYLVPDSAARIPTMNSFEKVQVSETSITILLGISSESSSFGKDWDFSSDA